MSAIHSSLEGIEMCPVMMYHIHFLGGFPVTVDRQSEYREGTKNDTYNFEAAHGSYDQFTG